MTRRVQYTGEQTIVIPAVPITVNPGDILDLDELGLVDNPNPGLFVELVPPAPTPPAKKAAAKADPVPAPVAEPTPSVA